MNIRAIPEDPAKDAGETMSPLRLLTALTVIGGCGWPVWEGSQLIGYASAVSKTELRQWTSVPGVAASASEYALTYVDDTSDGKTILKRRDELVQILKIKPLSSTIWLKLAESRIDAHDPPPQVVDALQLSAITGPNEGYLVIQRGLVGIWQWEILPTEAKARAISDLMARPLSASRLTWLRTTLSEKSEPVRQDIVAALRTQGFSMKSIEGLDAK